MIKARPAPSPADLIKIKGNEQKGPAGTDLPEVLTGGSPPSGGPRSFQALLPRYPLPDKELKKKTFEILIFAKNFNCCDQNYNFWAKCRFFGQNFDFRLKIRFLTEISIFDQNYDFWPKLRFLTKITIFDQNYDFWLKFRFFTKISMFVKNFDFYP